MRIATLGPYCAAAIRAAGHDAIVVDEPPNSREFRSTVAERVTHGRALWDRLQSERPDLLLDSHGSAMLFLEPPRADAPPALLHERLGIPLVSLWPETLRIYFKGVDPVILHAALRSPTWYKAVVARSHLEEMQWLRIPGCFHMTLAAQEGPLPDGPATPDLDGPAALFAGSQQSRYFAHGDGVDTRRQVTGALAAAAIADGSATSFVEAAARYGLITRPEPDASPTTQAALTQAYFDHKLFYSAWRNLTARDRFVLRLARALGERFLLIGHERWTTHYGLQVAPRVPYERYLDLLRRTPVCINMANGDNDTGLNVRHFEIPAVAGFMLAYETAELAAIFEPGRDIETFRSETELLDKVAYYSTHPTARQAIAAAGQQRILREHRLHHRVATALDYVTRAAAAPESHRAMDSRM